MARRKLPEQTSDSQRSADNFYKSNNTWRQK